MLHTKYNDQYKYKTLFVNITLLTVDFKKNLCWKHERHYGFLYGNKMYYCLLYVALFFTQT